MPTNVEIKARTQRTEILRKILLEHGAVCKGTDLQTDTYFHANEGRLKLREGTIENNLIHYQRDNDTEAKLSEVLLYKALEGKALKVVLTKALGVAITVKKSREIYCIENVKFHLDEVEGLGSFVEIEAITVDESLSQEALRQQCEHYQQLLGVEEKDLVAFSYSDLLLQQRLGNKELLKFQ